MRRATIAAVLALWAGALAALFLYHPGEVNHPVPVAGAAVDTQASGGNWWGVYLQGHKVGFVHHVLTYSPGSVSFREESVLQLTTLAKKQTIRTTASGELTDAFALRSLSYTLEAGPTRFQLEASPYTNGLRVTVSPGGETVDLEGDVFLPLGLRTAAMKPPLEDGRVVRGPVFDPLTRTSSTLQLAVMAQAPLPGSSGQSAWRIMETWRDVQSLLWVDDQGQLLREEGPMGLVAVREAKEDAVSLASAAADWDAVEAVSLPVDPPLDNPRGRTTLRVRLSGIPIERIPTGSGQSTDASAVLIRRMDMAQISSYSLPYTAPDRAAELASTTSIQADHPRILALTEAIVGGERDALTATRLLVDWVYRYLDKVPTASLPDALQVLDLGQGDCNEHAVLLTALARAAGIPARMATGLVYADGAFLYHAWTEVWIGQWLPVDAALNQLPVDATHIRLAGGERDEQALMMGMLGNLSIQILDATNASGAAPHR